MKISDVVVDVIIVQFQSNQYFFTCSLARSLSVVPCARPETHKHSQLLTCTHTRTRTQQHACARGGVLPAAAATTECTRGSSKLSRLWRQSLAAAAAKKRHSMGEPVATEQWHGGRERSKQGDDGKHTAVRRHASVLVRASG